MLTRELPPTGASLAGALAATALVGAASLVLAMQCPPRVAQTPSGEVAIATTVPSIAERPEEPTMIEHAVVLRVGATTYMQIGGAAAEGVLARADVPRPRIVLDGDRGGIVTAVAPVELSALPGELSALHGRQVRVDDQCDATIKGFSFLARLVGTPEYAGAEGPWTAELVFEHGSRTLVAELSGCVGRYARDAQLPPLVRAINVEDEVGSPTFEAAARARLLASSAAVALQHEWAEYRDSVRRYHDEEAAGERWHESDDASIAVSVLRHPTTEATWALAHARLDGGCGLPEANLVALYEVMPGGELSEVSAFASDLTAIYDVIDIDDDGRFELVGKGWLGLDTVVIRDSGITIDKLEVAFWACSC
jgi:hypothetical protein